MQPFESAEALQDFLAAVDVAGVAGQLDAVIRFYVERPAEGLADDDGDMLLFQYGCYNWGEGERFEVDLTRQFMTADEVDDDALSQLHFTLYYAPDEALRAAGAHNLWCLDRDGVSAFRAAVLGNPVMALVEGRTPEEVRIAWDRV